MTTIPATAPDGTTRDVLISTVRVDDADGPGVAHVLVEAPAETRMVPREAIILGYAITRHAILVGETRPAGELLGDLPWGDPTHGNSGPGGRL